MKESKYVFVEENEQIQRSMLKNTLNEKGYEVNDPRPIKIHIPGDKALKSIKHISDFSAFMMQKKLDDYMSGEQETEKDLYDFNPVNKLDHETVSKHEESMYQYAANVGLETQELNYDEPEITSNDGSGASPSNTKSSEVTEDTTEESGSETNDETTEG